MIKLALALLTALVNPFIGSGGHGHVFVGADVPHGMVHAGPINTTLGWDWCSGYHDSDSTLAGYAQTRLGGTGIADYGDFVLLPLTCDDPTHEEFIAHGSFRSAPGEFELTQSPSGIIARGSATARTAKYRFIFPRGSEAYLKIDLRTGAKSLLARQGFKQGTIRQSAPAEFELFRNSDSWTKDRKIWALARFSKPAKIVSTDSTSFAILSFGRIAELNVDIAISQKGPEALRENLKEADISFEQARKDAAAYWQEELSSIEVLSLEPKADTIFRTALFHTLVSPQLFSDVPELDEYSVFSLWDTYRAVHPLFNIIDWRAGAYINSLLSIRERSGKLPVWPLAGEETYCMVGIHSITAMVDAALKGVEDVDPHRVLEACKQMLSQPTYGMPLWDEYGYLPCDKVNYSVSVELEYCINAKAIETLALALGDNATAREFSQRALRYSRHFDPGTGFMRPVLSDGSFREPFDPSFSLHDEADYVEGNAWQYTFLVPQDVEGLVRLFGGKDKLEQKLDGLFSASSILNEGASADITGMIGQYAHGNEPSHHIAYLYTLLGRPEKTARLLRQICSEFYTTSPDGLIGNEDCGQMSAWYVFTTLGFYPVDPVGGEYVFGSPLCREATIRTNRGTEFRIHVLDNSEENIYIQSITLDSKPLASPTLSHSAIMEGGDLEITMGPEPSIWY